MTDTVPVEAYERAEPAGGDNGHRTPPHNRELELTVIGAAITRPTLLDEILAAGLATGDFYEPAHQRVFQRIEDMAAAGEPVDAQRLKAAGADEQLLGAALQAGAETLLDHAPTKAQDLIQLRRARDLQRDLDAASHLANRGLIDQAADLLRPTLERTATSTTTARDLHIEAIADVAARVDAADPPKFLARPVWVEDAYGVIGAEDKAGKSWAALDLAVAVACGGRWLDTYECEIPGPVLIFLSEGSDRKSIRRLRAVAEFHGVTLEDLPIRVCHRAPNLTRAEHLAEIRRELEGQPPRLVILDPLYLSLGNTNASQLTEMGNVLGALQYEVQAIGAALAIVHHWNQTGSGNDRKRFTGAGAAEWGRVLVSVSVDDRRTTDGDDTIVDLTWRFLGDEIPDITKTLTRRVWADDIDDLHSPMHYCITPSRTAHQIAENRDDPAADTALAASVLEVLSDGTERSQTKLRDACKELGHKGRNADMHAVFLRMAENPDCPVKLRLTGSRGQNYLYRIDPEREPV